MYILSSLNLFIFQSSKNSFTFRNNLFKGFHGFISGDYHGKRLFIDFLTIFTDLSSAFGSSRVETYKLKNSSFKSKFFFDIKKYFLKYVFLYANGSITNIHNWWGRSISITNDFPFKTNAHSLLVTKCNFVPHLMPLGLRTPCLWITAAIFYEKFIMVNTKLKQAIPDDYEEEHAGPFLNQSMS